MVELKIACYKAGNLVFKVRLIAFYSQFAFYADGANSGDFISFHREILGDRILVYNLNIKETLLKVS